MLRRCYGNKLPEMQHKRVRFGPDDIMSTKNSNSLDDYKEVSPSRQETFSDRRFKAGSNIILKVNQNSPPAIDTTNDDDYSATREESTQSEEKIAMRAK